MADFTNWNNNVDAAPSGRDLIALLSNSDVRVMRRADGVWFDRVSGNQRPYAVVAYAEVLSREPAVNARP